MKRSTFIFKVFLTVYVHQFGWLSERGGNFLNLLQKEGGRGGGVPTLEETLSLHDKYGWSKAKDWK